MEEAKSCSMHGEYHGILCPDCRQFVDWLHWAISIGQEFRLCLWCNLN